MQLSCIGVCSLTTFLSKNWKRIVKSEQQFQEMDFHE